MIVDQPQSHVTCEPGRHFSQLRNLVARDPVQFLLGVKLCAEVQVVLRGENQDVMRIGVLYQTLT